MGKKLTFRKKTYGSEGLDDLGESVGSLVLQLNANPLLSGELIRGVSINNISPQKNIVRHRLGRKVKGAIVVLQSKEGNVSAIPSSNSSEIYLLTSVSMTVSLWVF